MLLLKRIFAFILVSLLFVPAVHAKDINLKIGKLDASAHLVLADGKTLKDKTVLLTHGTLAHNKMEFIASMQKFLAERGVNSLAINLTLGVSGRKGMYACEVPHLHQHTDALDEIGFWLKWLKSEGANDIVLMGHSRGGNQTAWFAAERPDPSVKKVVLIAPATWSVEKAANGYKKRHKKELTGTLEMAKKLAAEDKMFPEKTGVLYCENTKVSGKSFASYYTPNENFHSPNLVPKIKVPVLVVAGADDKVVANLIPEMKKIENDNVKLSVIDEAGHFFRDFAGEDAADAISEFIE